METEKNRIIARLKQLREELNLKEGDSFNPFKDGVIWDCLDRVVTSGIPKTAVFHWLALARYMAGRKGEAFPSISKLAQKVHCCDAESRLSIKILANLELVRIIPPVKEGSKGHATNTYELLWHRCFWDENWSPPPKGRPIKFIGGGEVETGVETVDRPIKSLEDPPIKIIEAIYKNYRGRPIKSLAANQRETVANPSESKKIELDQIPNKEFKKEFKKEFINNKERDEPPSEAVPPSEEPLVETSSLSQAKAKSESLSQLIEDLPGLWKACCPTQDQTPPTDKELIEIELLLEELEENLKEFGDGDLSSFVVELFWECESIKWGAFRPTLAWMFTEKDGSCGIDIISDRRSSNGKA